MTRWLALLVAVLLLLPAVAFADTVTLLWTGSPTATSYQLEQSANAGTTWTLIPAAQVTTTCTGVACSAIVTGISATGTILFRFGSVNAVGTTTRFSGGAWYCGSCSPPLASSQTGIQ